MLEGVNLGFVQFAADYIIIIGFFTIAAWIALMRGAGLINSATIALPLTFVTYEVGLSSAGLAPLFSSGLTIPATGVAIFLVVFVFFYVALLRAMANNSGGGNGIIAAFISALTCSTMALATWHQFYPFTTMWQFGYEIARFFDTSYYFWWITGSIAPLFLTLGFSFQRRPTQKLKTAEDKYASGVVYTSGK